MGHGRRAQHECLASLGQIMFVQCLEKLQRHLLENIIISLLPDHSRYANIWTGYTPFIPEQLCSFIHTPEMKCLAPAGRMTSEDSLTITVNIRQNFLRLKKTKEQINACHGTLNALKWVCFLFTHTFELYSTILHGFCSIGMASW